MSVGIFQRSQKRYIDDPGKYTGWQKGILKEDKDEWWGVWNIF